MIINIEDDDMKVWETYFTGEEEEYIASLPSHATAVVDIQARTGTLRLYIQREAFEWLRDNASASWKLTAKTPIILSSCEDVNIDFESDDDAALFKLTWLKS